LTRLSFNQCEIYHSFFAIRVKARNFPNAQFYSHIGTLFKQFISNVSSFQILSSFDETYLEYFVDESRLLRGLFLYRGATTGGASMCYVGPRAAAGEQFHGSNLELTEHFGCKL
jgi:hypothetical protein